ncbi:MAG: alpha/beta fold hydrolase [Propionibacteriaceae bacterium]
MFNLFGNLLSTTVDRPDGTRLALLTAEAPRPEGRVLAVHGFTGGKEDFLFLLPELAAKGWAGSSVDLRGVHQSTSTGPYDLDTLAADLVAVTHDLGAPVHLVAHSFGGLVAQRAVIVDPAAFASLTLICSGPAGFMASADLVPVTIDRVTRFARELAAHDLAQAWDAKTAYENVDMHPALASFLRERFVAGTHAAAVRNVEALLDASDVVEELAATGVPCAVLYGEHDGTWSQVTQNDMAVRLGTVPIAIPEATHLPMLENIDATAEVLDTFFRRAETLTEAEPR